jgi:hypothetical protein
MIPETWIVVPTYWTFPTTAPGKELFAFDHPTPLDEEGTLARTLESFRKLQGKFNVLIIAGACNPLIEAQIDDKIRQIVRPFIQDFPLYLASPANLAALNALLPEPILRLDTYGNIRNVQLALPYLAGATSAVGIDDDEVIEIPDFVSRATRFLGNTVDGVKVGGVAGPYFDSVGDYRVTSDESIAKNPNIFLKKNFFMNEALRKAMTIPAGVEIVRSNVAFGGNMTMPRATIARTCHDPYIPRGEDYDYVINAAMDGTSFFFQPGMWITHLPPGAAVGSQAGDKASKLVSDIRRFIYFREKTRIYRELYPRGPLEFLYLLPYPGIYLDSSFDLQKQGILALDEKYPEYCQVHSPEKLVEDATTVANLRAREFFAYQEKWRHGLAQGAKNPKCAATIATFAVTK